MIQKIQTSLKNTLVVQDGDVEVLQVPDHQGKVVAVRYLAS